MNCQEGDLLGLIIQEMGELFVQSSDLEGRALGEEERILAKEELVFLVNACALLRICFALRQVQK